LQSLDSPCSLEIFINQWNKISHLVIHEDIPSSNIRLNTFELPLIEFFSKYEILNVKHEYRYKQGDAINVWKTVGLKQDEVKNTAILKWLLDNSGSHGQKNLVLLEFLKLLPNKFQEYYPNQYLTLAESCPLGERENRIDIEINAEDFLLFIEIKINATEGEQQLQRYAEIAQRKAGLRDWAVVYLTRHGNLPETYQSENFIGLSWRSIAHMLSKYVNNQPNPTKTTWLIQQFADHISSFKS
jgi:hypothetical protein